MFKTEKSSGFTLSEVMISMGMIGVLATLTLSTMGAKIQQRTRLAQFQTATAKMDTALKSIMADNGKVYACYAQATDNDKSEYGLNVDTSIPREKGGCSAMRKEFVRAMGATRYCETQDENPVDGGCIPSNYPSPSTGFQDYKKAKAYVLDNSMILITDEGKDLRLFAVDVNGRKAPNKWGQDIFAFSVKYSETKSFGTGVKLVTAVRILPPSGCSYPTSSSVKSTATMYKEASGKR